MIIACVAGCEGHPLIRLIPSWIVTNETRGIRPSNLDSQCSYQIRRSGKMEYLFIYVYETEKNVCRLNDCKKNYYLLFMIESSN